MRARWASRRALLPHLAVVVWVPLCVVLGWWQATRVLNGNTLSYVYSVEWPLLALVGVWVWWVLIHTDPEKVGARAQRRAMAEAEQAGVIRVLPVRRPEDEDEPLAAYNDRLAELAADNRPKTWRHA